jgi:hypothetical protein
MQLPSAAARRDAHAERLKCQPPPVKIETFEVLYYPRAVGGKRVQLFDHHLLFGKALIQLGQRGPQLPLLLFSLRDLALDEVPWKRVVIRFAKMPHKAFLLFF